MSSTVAKLRKRKSIFLFVDYRNHWFILFGALPFCYRQRPAVKMELTVIEENNLLSHF